MESRPQLRGRSFGWILELQSYTPEGDEKENPSSATWMRSIFAMHPEDRLKGELLLALHIDRSWTCSELVDARDGELNYVIKVQILGGQFRRFGQRRKDEKRRGSKGNGWKGAMSAQVLWSIPSITVFLYITDSASIERSKDTAWWWRQRMGRWLLANITSIFLALILCPTPTCQSFIEIQCWYPYLYIYTV